MKRLVMQLFGRMPREFASPQRKVVESVDELLAEIDQHNGLTDCFVSVYPFADETRSYGNVAINKAVFDFDGTWDHLVSAHEWLEDQGVAHFVVFSGSDRSGHLYVLTRPTNHQQSLEYFQRNVIADKCGLRRCEKCGGAVQYADKSIVAAFYCPQCDRRYSENETEMVIDENLVGDPATMIRIPNTKNPDAGRFCVPLKPEEVTRDVESVYELAESQRNLALADIVCGEKTPRITQCKVEAEELYRSHDEKRRLAGFESDAAVMDEFEVEVTPKQILDDIECECMRSMIIDDDGYRTRPDLGHNDRRVLISYLVERGYNPEEIAKFLKFAISEDKARHSIVDEEQPVRIWRDGVRAPNAVSLKRMGKFRQSCPEHAANSAGVEL